MAEKITSAHLNQTRKNDSQDLLHDIIIYLNKFNEEKILGLIKKKQLSFFTARMMIFQYHSNTSPFFKIYKKNTFYKELLNEHQAVYNPEETKQTIKKKLDIEKKLKWIDDILNELDWFEVEAFKIYYKDKHSYSTLAKATNISKNTLYKAIRKVHDHIRYKINE